MISTPCFCEDLYHGLKIGGDQSGPLTFNASIKYLPIVGYPSGLAIRPKLQRFNCFPQQMKWSPA